MAYDRGSGLIAHREQANKAGAVIGDFGVCGHSNKKINDKKICLPLCPELRMLMIPKKNYNDTGPRTGGESTT